MATPTIIPNIQSEVAALAHRHLTLTYGLVGTLVLMLALMGLGGYLGLKAFDTQLARQEVRDAQYQSDRKTFLDQLTAHDSERAAQAQQIADLEAQIAHRDAKPLPPAVQAGLKPDATFEQAKTALEQAYVDTPSFGTLNIDTGGSIALSVPQSQQVIQTKINLDTTRGDLKDTQSIVDLQKQANVSLTNDLGACKDLNVKAEADIAGYRKLAKRSRWQKFIGGAEKVMLLAVGGYIGHKI